VGVVMGVGCGALVGVVVGVADWSFSSDRKAMAE